MTHPQPKLSLEEIKSNLEAIIINGTGPGEYGFDESGIAVTDECLEQILAFFESILPEEKKVDIMETPEPDLFTAIGFNTAIHEIRKSIRGAGK